MDYIIVSYYLTILRSLCTPPLLSFSFLILCHPRQTPFPFQPLCMPMFFSLSPCSSFLSEMSACTDPHWLPSCCFFFPFFFFVKQRPGWAAGGHSHIKITMSHPGDLCMCQRVQSQTPHQHTQSQTETHTHTHALRCIVYNCKTHKRIPACFPTHYYLFQKSMFLLMRGLLTWDVLLPVLSHSL